MFEQKNKNDPQPKEVTDSDQLITVNCKDTLIFQYKSVKMPSLELPALAKMLNPQGNPIPNVEEIR